MRTLTTSAVAAAQAWVEARPYRLLRRLQGNASAERSELIARLRASPASIAPKYLYDALGCALFEAICALPEYYPTRTERSIYVDNLPDIAWALGRQGQLVDLGSGDSAKAELLMPALEPSRYVAVDIAPEALEPALARLAASFPDVELVGVATDFSQHLDLSGVVHPGPVNFFYPGSSIGNFAPDEARAFLLQIRKLCGTGGGLLIGVDLKKDADRLRAAYDDVLGVTAAFNRNALLHVNALIGSDFMPADFAHVARYDAVLGRVEMHLEARRDVTVCIAGMPRRFAVGERIHTESSYKYTTAEFERLLDESGFVVTHQWQDDKGDFAVFYAQ